MSCGIAAVYPSLLSSSKSKFVSAGVPLPNAGNVGRISHDQLTLTVLLLVTLGLTHLDLEKFQRTLSLVSLSLSLSFIFKLYKPRNHHTVINVSFFLPM
jgi:hypothetical protein